MKSTNLKFDFFPAESVFVTLLLLLTYRLMPHNFLLIDGLIDEFTFARHCVDSVCKRRTQNSGLHADQVRPVCQRKSCFPAEFIAFPQVLNGRPAAFAFSERMPTFSACRSSSLPGDCNADAIAECALSLSSLAVEQVALIFKRRSSALPTEFVATWPGRWRS